MDTQKSKIIRADCKKALNKVDDSSVQLVVTSPPYNIGKEYEKDVRLSLDQYLEWLEPIIDQLCSKVAENGSVCWQVGNYVKDGEVFPLDLYFYEMFRKNGLKLRNRIIWHYNFGLNARRRFSGRYETLLWFTKSDDYTFNLDPVRVPQLYPGKRHSAKKGDRAGKLSGNPLGKNPSDFWEFSGEQFFENNPIWELPNVKSNHPEKTQHPCQFPSELVERCILAFSNEGDLVLDPFVGSGTTVIAAIKYNRVGLGIDKSAEYAKLARQRIKQFQKGELKLRPAGKGVRKPKAGEKVSTIPNEWIEKHLDAQFLK